MMAGMYADALLQTVAQSMLASIAAVMGVPVPPVAISRDVDNAAADGSVVWVNPDWLADSTSLVCCSPNCPYELTLGILAHELAHLVYGDVFSPPYHRHTVELRADGFAAVALARLGVSPDAFSALMAQLASHHSQGPFGYPSRDERIEMIRASYECESAQLWACYYAGQRDAFRHFGLAA